MKKVTIVIMTAKTVRKECYESAVNQDYPCQVIVSAIKPEKLYGREDFWGREENILAHRKRLKPMLLASASDFFLWIDSDIVIPSNAVTEFMKQADQQNTCQCISVPAGFKVYENPKKEVIGGYYKLDGSHHFNSGLEQPHNGLVESPGILWGCVFMSRNVLEKVDWAFEKDKNCECACFSIAAHAAGFQTYLLSHVTCKHLERNISWNLKLSLMMHKLKGLLMGLRVSSVTQNKSRIMSEGGFLTPKQKRLLQGVK